MLVLLHCKTDPATRAFLWKVYFLVDGACRFMGIIRDDFRSAARWRQQHILFIDLNQVVDNGRYDRRLASPGITLQNKDFVVIIVGDEF